MITKEQLIAAATEAELVFQYDNSGEVFVCFREDTDVASCFEAMAKALNATMAAQPAGPEDMAVYAAIAQNYAATAAQPVAYRYRVPTANGGSAWTFTKPQPELLLETQALGVIAGPVDPLTRLTLAAQAALDALDWTAEQATGTGRSSVVLDARTNLRAALAAATAAQPQPIEVTDAMVAAYLQANDAYWKRTDELPTPPNKWRTGTPSEATRESLKAALAAAPAAGATGAAE